MRLPTKDLQQIPLPRLEVNGISVDQVRDMKKAGFPCNQDSELAVLQVASELLELGQIEIRDRPIRHTRPRPMD